jgi:DNA-binding beta-propeller fold protein YncE
MSYLDWISRELVMSRFSLVTLVALLVEGPLFALAADTAVFGQVTTLAGSDSTDTFADGVGAAAIFWYPVNANFSPDGTKVAVADMSNGKIRLIEVATGNVTTLAGSGRRVVTDDGEIDAFADGVGAAASFWYPLDANFSPDGTKLVVADSSNNRIRLIVVATAEVTTLAGSGSAAFADGVGASAAFKGPKGASYSPDGTKVVVADTDNDRIRLIAVATAQVTTLAGGGIGAFVDGVGASAYFSAPYGANYSPDGMEVVVADLAHNRIR